MKQTIFYFPTIILTLLLMSCSGNKAKPENEILGKWRYAKIAADVVASDSLIEEKIISRLIGNRELETDEDGEYPLMIFREDGIVDNDGKPGTYSIEGDKLRVRGEGGSDFVDFEILEDTLVLSCDFPENLNKQMRVDLEIPDSVKIDRCAVNIFLVKEK